MPTHSLHRALAKALMGKPYQQVNSIMDAAAKYIPNPSHRNYGHSMPAILGLFAGDSDLLNAAILHLLIDRMSSEDPEFHRFLRVWAELK